MEIIIRARLHSFPGLNRDLHFIFLLAETKTKVSSRSGAQIAAALIADYASLETRNALYTCVYLEDWEINHTALHANENQRIRLFFFLNCLPEPVYAVCEQVPQEI